MPDTGGVADHPKRLTLSAGQVALLNEILAQSPSGVRGSAARIARGEVVPDEDAGAVVDVLAAAMLADGNFDGEELTGLGLEIDGMIGVVQQMSEHFYD
jgi:hypothetical protein